MEAISKASNEIDLMTEYRTRLTADVVTGKLDVREAAAKLSDRHPTTNRGRSRPRDQSREDDS